MAERAAIVTVVQEVVRSHRERFGRLDCSSTTRASGSARPSTRSTPRSSTCSWRSTCARWSSSKELGAQGIKSTALCPGFVDTAMTDFVKEHVKPEEMIQVSDIAETVRVLLKMSPGCVVPEIQFLRASESF